MSKRAEESAMKAYPKKEAWNKQATGHYDPNFPRRKAYMQGYEKAEKDTIERAIDWLKGRSNDYIFRDVYMGKEELKISSQMFDDLKKAMEGEE